MSVPRYLPANADITEMVRTKFLIGSNEAHWQDAAFKIGGEMHSGVLKSEAIAIVARLRAICGRRIAAVTDCRCFKTIETPIFQSSKRRQTQAGC